MGKTYKNSKSDWHNDTNKAKKAKLKKIKKVDYEEGIQPQYRIKGM